MINDPRLRPFMRAKITVAENGCWLWQGYLTSAGYARVWIDDERHQAHRIVYEDLIGPIPAGLVCDHLCRVRRCINPEHIEPVTTQENIKRGIAGELNTLRGRAVTHCPQGHEYTPENTYRARRSGGKPGRSRQCRACTNIRRTLSRARAAQ